MPKVELNLEDDELKQLLLGDRDKAMQLIMAKILDEILKSEATEQIKAKAYERLDERTNSMLCNFLIIQTRGLDMLQRNLEIFEAVMLKPLLDC